MEREELIVRKDLKMKLFRTYLVETWHTDGELVTLRGGGKSAKTFRYDARSAHSESGFYYSLVFKVVFT